MDIICRRFNEWTSRALAYILSPRSLIHRCIINICILIPRFFRLDLHLLNDALAMWRAVPLRAGASAKE